MSRFPPPPPREDPLPMVNDVSSLQKQDLQTNEISSDEEEDEDDEQDYLTEQYLRDKQALFNREMTEVVEEIDTSTVHAKNIISLVLRNDIPYIQRRIITLLAKAVAEQSLELSVERTHGEDNTSMLDKTKLVYENKDAPDFSCQVNVISKSDFIKRQNDKRSGYLQTPLRDPRDNFNAEFYFNCVDKMYQLRPGKPIIKSLSVSELRKQRKKDAEQDAKQNVYKEDLSNINTDTTKESSSHKSDQNGQHDPLSEFQPDQDSSQTSPEESKPRELTEYERIQQHALAEQSNQQPKKQKQDTFLMPAGLGLLPPDVQFDDVNDLIKYGTSEMALNEWADASVSGCPVGHIFLHSTITQSTHQLMINALSPLPTLIIYCADAQSLGRGRSQNSWVSPPGCLMYNFSMKVFNPQFLPFLQYFSSWLHVKSIYHALEHTCCCSHCKLLPHNRVHTIFDKKMKHKALKLAQKRVDTYNQRLAAAVEAQKGAQPADSNAPKPEIRVPAEPCMRKIDLKIKWPNDLYINGKKISGTLLSSVADMQASGAVNFTAHLGTGLNVSNGAANGKDAFSQQHSDYLTLNDALILSYQEQIRFNRETLLGTDNNDDGEDDGGRPLPELLDEDDMDLLLLQERAALNQIQRKMEIVQLQNDQAKWRKEEKKRKAKENKELDDAIEARKKREDGSGGEANSEATAVVPASPNDQNDKDSEEDEDCEEDCEVGVEEEEDGSEDGEELYLRPEELFLLTREVLLASITLNLSLALPHFNQFGFLPFEKEYYKWWLHQDQVITIKTKQVEGVYQITGLDPDTGYLTARNSATNEIVELQPETHSFDVNSLTVKPKKGMEPVEEKS